MASGVDQIILLIVAGVLAARAGRRLRIPESIPLLVTGYLLGADVLGFWQPAVLGINLEFLTLIAIPVILFYDGLKTDALNLARMWKTVLSVTTLAVFLTVAGIACLAHYLLGLSWLASLLLGAILSSTDAAAVLPVLRNLNISQRVSSLLSAEAVLNDATAITLFLVLFGLASGTGVSLRAGFGQFLYYLVASSGIGVLVGVCANELFRKIGISGDLTFASVVVLLAAYSLAQAAGVSSVVAVVLAALVFRYFIQSSSVDPLERLNTLSAWENLSFLALAIVFLVLGGEIHLAAILPYLLPGLLVSVLFVLVVRPATMLISMFADHSFSVREKLFISWAGSPRGAVSAALASIVIASASGGGIAPAEANAIFSVTIIVILFTIAVASFTASKAAGLLLGASEGSLEARYRLLSTQLKTMMVAARRQREDWKSGLIPTKTYDEIKGEHDKQMKAIERELEEITNSAPTLRSRERSVYVRELLMNQIAALDESYGNKELSQDAYEYLLKAYRSQIQILSELEERDKLIEGLFAQEQANAAKSAQGKQGRKGR